MTRMYKLDQICNIVKYGVSESHTLKQFSKHVREIVNDPQLFANKRAHFKNMANFVVLICDNRDTQVRWCFTLKRAR